MSSPCIVKNILSLVMKVWSCLQCIHEVLLLADMKAPGVHSLALVAYYFSNPVTDILDTARCHDCHDGATPSTVRQNNDNNNFHNGSKLSFNSTKEIAYITFRSVYIFRLELIVAKSSIGRWSYIGRYSPLDCNSHLTSFCASQQHLYFPRKFELPSCQN